MKNPVHERAIFIHVGHLNTQDKIMRPGHVMALHDFGHFAEFLAHQHIAIRPVTIHGQQDNDHHPFAKHLGGYHGNVAFDHAAFAQTLHPAKTRRR